MDAPSGMKKTDFISLAQAMRENRMKEFMAQYKDVQGDAELFERTREKATPAPRPQRRKAR
jgi:hypothetical protein